MPGNLNAEKFPILRGPGRIKFNPSVTPKPQEVYEIKQGTGPVRRKIVNPDIQIDRYKTDLNKLRTDILNALVKDPYKNLDNNIRLIDSLAATYETGIVLSNLDKNKERDYIFTINIFKDKYTTLVNTVQTAVNEYINNDEVKYTDAVRRITELMADNYIQDRDFLKYFKKPYIEQFNLLRKQKGEQTASKQRNNNAAAEQTRQNQSKKDAMLQLRGELNASMNGKNTNTHTATLLNELKELMKKSINSLDTIKNNSNSVTGLTEKVNTGIDVLRNKYTLLVQETGLNKNSIDYKGKVIKLCEKYKVLWKYVLESINAFKKDDPSVYKTLHIQMFDIDHDIAKIMEDKYRQESKYYQFSEAKGKLKRVNINNLEKKRNNITKKMYMNESKAATKMKALFKGSQTRKLLKIAAEAAAKNAKNKKNAANRLQTEEAERAAEEAKKAAEEAQRVAEEEAAKVAEEEEIISGISGRNTNLAKIQTNNLTNNTSAANKLKRREEYNRKVAEAAAAKKNAENKRLAATKLQALYRGSKTRKNLKKAEDAKKVAEEAQRVAEAAKAAEAAVQEELVSMSGENGESNFFSTYPGNNPPGKGGPGNTPSGQGGPRIPSGRFAKIYQNIETIRSNLNKFNTTLKKPPQNKPSAGVNMNQLRELQEGMKKPSQNNPNNNVNMNQLRELQEGMSNRPNNQTTNQSNFNEMTRKMEELKKGRRQSRKNRRSNKTRKNKRN